MSGTILQNTTGPFTSLPFSIPPDGSLSLGIAGTTFSARLQGTLDPASTDWIDIVVLTASTQVNFAKGLSKFRLVIDSGTVVTAQYGLIPNGASPGSTAVLSLSRGTGSITIGGVAVTGSVATS